MRVKCDLELTPAGAMIADRSAARSSLAQPLTELDDLAFPLMMLGPFKEEALRQLLLLYSAFSGLAAVPMPLTAPLAPTPHEWPPRVESHVAASIKTS